MTLTATRYKSAVIKTLTTVEANRNKSNQHEFNGVLELKELFGKNKRKMSGFISSRGSDLECPINLTWYDARVNHPARSEFRLYFSSNPVMDMARAGDEIIIGFDKTNLLICQLIRKEHRTSDVPITNWQKLNV